MNDHQLLFLLLIIYCSTPTSGQSPAAAPSSPPPTNVTAILEKSGRFATFIRLLQNTKVADQINTELNNSKLQGVTIFAPTDSSFSNLKAGTLNSFTDEQKVELMKFHVIPSFYSPSQFQTATNPLRTQAGGSLGSFPMNVTSSGNQVNITTGATNATVANTVYADGQLAVYQVDQVLLPLSFFTTPATAPAPSEAKKDAGRRPADSPTGSNSSGATPVFQKMAHATAAFVVLVAALS